MRPEVIKKEQKILLALFPFWTPLVPPLGISCLKSFLQKEGYHVRTVDANMVKDLRERYDEYFAELCGMIPPEKQGNFYNTGHDVLRNHMMAHLNYTDEAEYLELVKFIIYQRFYVEVTDERIQILSQTLQKFYGNLEEYLKELLEVERPDLFGISVYSGSLPASLFAFQYAKEKYPQLITVMGGGVFTGQLAMGTPDLEYFRQMTTDYIDAIFIGEGEQLFLQYLKGELPKEQRVYQLQDLNGQTIDITNTEIPDFSGLDVEGYPYLISYASRSCPFQCSFCAETIMWGTYRKKCGGQIADELTQLYQKHQSQLFLMGDSLLNPIIDDLSHELMNRPVAIYYDGYLRADQHVCNPENTLRWRQGGFYRARLGVESGSPHVLELMGKKITPAQIRMALTSLAEAGIKTTTYWVIGHPEETEEDFLETLNLIEELKDVIYEAECNPFTYYYTGQAASDTWAKTNRSIPLYPEWARKMLVTQDWILDCEPKREEIYQRVCRFIQHCSNLKIPNPYSMSDIFEADQRWLKLHKNAVPPLMDFIDRTNYTDECKQVKRMAFAEEMLRDEDTFAF